MEVRLGRGPVSLLFSKCLQRLVEMDIFDANTHTNHDTKRFTYSVWTLLRLLRLPGTAPINKFLSSRLFATKIYTFFTNFIRNYIYCICCRKWDIIVNFTYITSKLRTSPNVVGILPVNWLFSRSLLEINKVT